MFLSISFLYSKGNLCSFPTRGRTSKLAYPIKRYSQNKSSDLKNDDFTFTLRLHLIYIYIYIFFLFLHLHLQRRRISPWIELMRVAFKKNVYRKLLKID